jgi:predicted metal-binding protein
MENNAVFESMTGLALELGAFRAAIIPVEGIETDAGFRDMCAANYCGNYGKNWMCPPDAGDIHELMAELRTYSYAMVYQTVSELEDSFDFEGMMEAGARHNQLMAEIRRRLADAHLSRVLHLGAGGCRMCEVCGKRTGEPCRHPDLAVASLETYGVNVSKLATAAGMKYINGQDTVTYFGAVLFDV